MAGKIQVQEVDVARERSRKRVLVGSLVTLAIAVLAGGAFLSWHLTPPAMPETPEEAALVMKSARFARLSKDQKQPYYDRIREQWGMDRDLRRAWRSDEALHDAARDMFRQMMGERLDKFMLADAQEREAMAEQGMGWGRPRGEGGGGWGGGDSAERRNRLSNRMANGSAQRSAAMGEVIRSRQRNGDGGGGGPR